MGIDFSDYLNDIIRGLIILYVSKDYKSISLTERKLELYDFFLRFPKTMTLSEEQSQEEDVSFEEYYSFFHWQPDIIRYRQATNYLIAKGFAEKEIDDSVVVYKITDLGKTVIEDLNNPYKNQLTELMINNVKQLSKLSDKKIEEMIQEKSKKHIKRGAMNETKVKA